MFLTFLAIFMCKKNHPINTTQAEVEPSNDLSASGVVSPKIL